jgi:hypothetical protein
MTTKLRNFVSFMLVDTIYFCECVRLKCLMNIVKRNLNLNMIKMKLIENIIERKPCKC